ncbi:tetratricopeptide repeat protein [Deltaproteobacteria bacterium TL4]
MSHSSPEKKSWLDASFLTFLWIMLLTWIAYFDTLRAPFFFDDITNIAEQQSFGSLSVVWKNVWSAFYLPQRGLVNLTLALNYHFHQLEVWGYHAVNISIHAINAFILLQLIKILGSSHAKPIPRFSLYCTVAYFVVHPLMTASVNYTMQRATEMLTMVYMLTVISYLQMKRAQAKKQVLWGLSLVVNAWFAYQCKEISLTLPLLLMSYEILIRAHTSSLIPFVKKLFIPLTLFVFIALFYLYQLDFFSSSLHSVGFNSPLLWSPWQQFQAQMQALLHYWKMLLFPLSHWLNIDHDFRISTLLIDGWSMLAALIHLLLLGVAWNLAQKRYLLSALGIVWFYVTFFPYTLIPENDILVDYKAYFSGIGFFLIFADLLSQLYPLLCRHKLRGVIWGLLGFALLGTWSRNSIYESSISLWTDAAQKSPQKARVHNNLGDAYFEKEQWAQATVHFKKAVELNATYLKAKLNLAKAYMQAKQYLQAQQIHEELMAIIPKNYELNYDIARRLNLEGNKVEGIQRYHQLLELIQQNPTDPQNLLYRTSTYNSLGKTYLELEQWEQAKESLNLALELDPDHATAHYNLGTVWLKQRNPNLAIPHLLQSIKINPNNVEGLNNLGVAYLQLGFFPQAKLTFQAVLTLSPTHPDALQNLRFLKQRFPGL